MISYQEIEELTQELLAEQYQEETVSEEEEE